MAGDIVKEAFAPGVFCDARGAREEAVAGVAQDDVGFVVGAVCD